jgi:hypothetical protein
MAAASHRGVGGVLGVVACRVTDDFFWALYDVKGHYGYSNRINYLLLAELIEALSGDHIPQRDAWGIGE